MQQHKITDCSAEPCCKCAEIWVVSQQRHNAAHNSHKQFFCCLYSLKIVCIRRDSVLKSRLFFAKCFHFCRCNTSDKWLLFVINVVVAHFISFKPERKSSC